MSQYDEQNSEIVQEALSFEISQRIFTLIRSNPNSSLRTIAEMLGAINYLSIIDVGRNKAPVLHLDVNNFVKELRVKKELNPLLMPDLIVIENETILPPDEGEIIPGSGVGIEEKDILPRTRFLIEILSDLDLKYEVHDGVNSPNMMRRLSYKVFVIPGIKKLVLVNNEEGNATFVVHDVEKEDWRKYGEYTKNQLKSLGSDKVSMVIFNKSSDEWKQEIVRLLISKSTETGESSKEISEMKNRTPETALVELENAFQEWLALPIKNRGDFNISWLSINHIALTSWTYRKDSKGKRINLSIEELVAKSKNQQLKDSFKTYEGKDRDLYSATIELEEAFELYKTCQEIERGNFSIAWLRKNGYENLYAWTKRGENPKLTELVVNSNNQELKDSFIKQEYHPGIIRNMESALTELENAFKKWTSDHKKGFSRGWLSHNGYKGLVEWARKKSLSIEDIVVLSKDENLKKNFYKQDQREHQKRSVEFSLQELEEAFSKWQSLPTRTRGQFHSGWMRRNGYTPLYAWTLYQGNPSLSELVDMSKNELLKQNFIRISQNNR
ncbi:MAG: hypothetical protein WCV83_01910 [Candidatus Magasanikbacteria bacterium]